jgi:LigD, primase-polymerase domain
VLDVAGRDIAITSPDNVFFRERNETKLDLVQYYLAVTEPLMRAVGGRPALMQRFPHGAEGSSFFQKRVPPVGFLCRARRSSRCGPRSRSSFASQRLESPSSSSTRPIWARSW